MSGFKESVFFLSYETRKLENSQCQFFLKHIKHRIWGMWSQLVISSVLLLGRKSKYISMAEQYGEKNLVAVIQKRFTKQHKQNNTK